MGATMRKPHGHKAGFSARHAPPLCTRSSASNAQHALGAAPLPVVIPACGPRGAAAARGCHGSKRQRQQKQLRLELAKLRAAQLAKELAGMGHTALEGAGLTVAFASAELTVEIGCARLPGLTGEGLRVEPAVTELAKHDAAEHTRGCAPLVGEAPLVAWASLM